MKAQGDMLCLVFSHLGPSSKEWTKPCALSDLFDDVAQLWQIAAVEQI